MIENKSKKNLNIYYANVIPRMKTKFTLEEEKVLHLIFREIKPFEKNPITFKIEKKNFLESWI